MSLLDRFGTDELGQTLRTFWREFALVGLFSAVANVLMLVPTLYMLQIFDRVLVSLNELTLLMVSLFTLFLLVVMATADWFRSRLLIRTGLRLDQALSTRVFDAGFAEATARPGSQLRPTGDLIELRQFLTGTGVISFFDLPWTPVYLAVLFILHPLLGWVALGFMLLQSLLVFLGQRVTREPHKLALAAQTDSQTFLQGKLRNAEVIHAMGMWPPLRDRWRQRQREALSLHAQSHRVAQGVTSASKWLRYAQQSGGLAVGAILVINGEISAGAMIAANVLMTRTLAPIDQLASAWKQFHGARQAYERLVALLGRHPRQKAAALGERPQGRVEVRNITAGAPDSEDPILKQVSLVLEPGTVTVVVGPSGSGKSTLARVVTGLWPAREGEVLLDGRPVRAWPRGELGLHLGYLPQDVELFDGTVADNIARLGEVDPGAAVQAAQMCGLHDAILQLPGGYDAGIGVGGHVLSGGQRQRIALARALYRNPRLVVLDEPNSSLDDAGERALEKAVSTLRSTGNTLLLITHRPSMVHLADQLVVMQAGQVLMAGPRDTVLQKLRAMSAASSTPHSQDHV
jgi:ATP-binding cassette, subfamily C, bacterial exporter for protease/lipase